MQPHGHNLTPRRHTDANGASGEALFETLRDTLLVMLSTDTGSTFADDLLDSQDVDLA